MFTPPRAPRMMPPATGTVAGTALPPKAAAAGVCTYIAIMTRGVPRAWLVGSVPPDSGRDYFCGSWPQFISEYRHGVPLTSPLGR
ncbi:hypothetical protein GCM10022252_48240 [Streptosporangium oxazolinicum]|uniref:Uncharacterized protein n=1 Tax=Streptosporangium oxazolinicum TaxID=909287 RepID=A0ABP8B5K2_9ACTN